MRYGTQHPHSKKEHTELYNILKFSVNQANIRRDTAIHNLQFLLCRVVLQAKESYKRGAEQAGFRED